MKTTLNILKDLTNSFGPSGFEDDVISVIKENSSFITNERDSMNNLYLGLDRIDEAKPIIVLDAHSDEVGFIVERIERNGGIKFIPLGGWHIGNIPSSSVLIKNRDGKLIKGVVASKPPHFMNPEEANKVPKLSDLTIDIGTSSYEETVELYGIEVGSPIVPDVSFEFDEKIGVVRAKAIDNRAGCALTVEALKRLNEKRETLNVNVVGVITSQEEVGLRGAGVAVNKIKPDLAIIFESSPADDTFKDSSIASGKLKGGPQLRIVDGNMISNPRLIKYARKIAEKHGIKYQVTVREKGGTNGGKYHLANQGIPSLVIAVPSRYIHTHYSYAAIEDIMGCLELAIKIIEEIKIEDIKSF